MSRYERYTEKEGQHDIEMLKLSHKFAMKMAVLVCMSIVSIVIMLGIFFGAVTPLALGILVIVAIVLGIISFSVTRSACL